MRLLQRMLTITLYVSFALSLVGAFFLALEFMKPAMPLIPQGWLEAPIPAAENTP